MFLRRRSIEKQYTHSTPTPDTVETLTGVKTPYVLLEVQPISQVFSSSESLRTSSIPRTMHQEPNFMRIQRSKVKTDRDSTGLHPNGIPNGSASVA